MIFYQLFVFQKNNKLINKQVYKKVKFQDQKLLAGACLLFKKSIAVFFVNKV